MIFVYLKINWEPDFLNTRIGQCNGSTITKTLDIEFVFITATSEKCLPNFKCKKVYSFTQYNNVCLGKLVLVLGLSLTELDLFACVFYAFSLLFEKPTIKYTVY